MTHSHDHTSVWWPEDRIKATLDTKFIVSRLRPENVPRLFDLPRWGEGLTSETYMEWILLKAGRLFLILDVIGIPDRIFSIVDESWDDDDLPIAEPNMDRLRLCPDGEDLALENRFFNAQWRFVVRGIAEGEHVTYTGNEGVPVEVLRTTAGSGVQGRDDTVDRVILAGSVCRVYMRTQVQVGGAPHFFSSAEVLNEIRALRKLAHPHLVSLYGSYFVDDTVCALFTGAETDRTLHSFLADQPQTFKRLSKEHRRQILVTWPHCLASAVSWLHARGQPHGAIRPSNILIDSNHHIFLGQFQALDSLLAPPRVNDIEAYNYAAPERWIRAPVPNLPPPQPSRVLLPSGGRTGRRKKPVQLALQTLNSAASKGTVIRIGLPGSPSRFSFAFSTSSSSSSSAASSTTTTTHDTQPSSKRVPLWPRRPNTLRAMPSLSSLTTTTASSSSASSSAASTAPSTAASTAPSSLAPLKSPALTIPLAADLFSLAAVTLDIITHLCKRSSTSFTSHRAARNRSAGRGGGMADASFHLARNSVQVQSWIALLEGDSLKRCRRDRGSDAAFWAVPRMLMVVRAMLGAEPERRPSARRVVRCFAAAVRERGGRGGLELHCVEKAKPKAKTKNACEGVEEEEVVKAKGGKKEVLVMDSSSVSEFDFGFSDAGSESEAGESSDRRDEVEVAMEEDEEMPIQVDRVSPQLSLPDLDVNITGIEGLTFRGE
ncbi:hypothetical protein N7462_002316 [Penicillium macrosclerotiorum]|uniref:uncharacterized protein n=1 Tax=Penicillium macrosclerotiorum TaxID=303699 RepID=UPI00254829FD|nr:uncharacterized protein N7462_002316 [Penicillium macrosclerotiorum]KAJ5692893.1 hypothetical protein N7462_002316 [Penicillium macrosclerotiorum]